MEAGTGRVDDLAALSTLDEANLLNELGARYNRDIIYTYIGDILISVNPYKSILIYGPEFEAQYRDIKVRGQLPPHVYTISDKAYQTMHRTGHPQACVVSGESGAGKTEITKLMVKHIIYLCRHDGTDLHERIVQVNPLLEAFGNAQTVMNNNSSRFGKFIELRFNHEGQVLGARIDEYLLEKSRVVSQGYGERNFHIFYYMFAGLSQEQLRNNLLDRPEKHRILRTLDGSAIYQDEAEFLFHQRMLAELQHIMRIVGFTPEDINMFFALLAAILHITDIQFDHDYDTDGVYIVDENMLEVAAELLGVLPEELAAALISNVTMLRGERIVMLKNIEQANDGRDALAKALYGRLFSWIVRQINIMLKPDQRYKVGSSISILDIAGFENFEHNSFEQLCINVANEQLQYYFNQHIFQWEMDEYAKEGVKGKNIKFVDNRPLVDLFLERPVGFFALMDEESRFPQATDQTMIDKINKHMNKKTHYKAPKGQGLNFIINHYAGQVVYSAQNFLEKNRDTLSPNLLFTMKNSESQIVCDLFSAALSDTGSIQMNPNAPKRTRKSALLCKPPDFTKSKHRSLSKKAGKRFKENPKADSYPIYENTIRTMGGQFKNSLADLMNKLLDAEPQFIRCIKPNQNKSPNLFNDILVTQQLKYTGVLETTRIRRQGYPTRILFPVFISRYKFACFPMTTELNPTGSNCGKILKKIGLKDWEIGKTKVFLRYWHVEQLNNYMDRLGWKIIAVQKYVRGFLARKLYRHHVHMAHQDQRALQGFTVYILKASEDKYYLQARQQDHDSQRYHKMQQQKIASFPYPQNIPGPKYPSGIPTGMPLPGMQHLKGPAGFSAKKKEGIFMPTPLILGTVERIQELRPVDTRPKPGIRRTPSQEAANPDYGYATDSLRSPVKKRNFDYDENSHYARQTSPQKAKTAQAFYENILQEALNRLPQLDPDIWGKVLYLEKDHVVAKMYVTQPEIIIDGSEEEYDGVIIGLGAFENPLRDSKVEKIRSHVGKGLRIQRDEDGSIVATRLTKNDIIVKGYKRPGLHCMSEDVIENFGRLKLDEAVKIFDMNEFKSQIGLEIKSSEMDRRRLQMLSLTALAFVRNTFDDLDTPCWFCIISFDALDAIGNEEVLTDVKKLANINLSEAEDVQLKKNWSRMSSLDKSGAVNGTGPGVKRMSRKASSRVSTVGELPGESLMRHISTRPMSPLFREPDEESVMYDGEDSTYGTSSMPRAGERHQMPQYNSNMYSSTTSISKKDWAKLKIGPPNQGYM